LSNLRCRHASIVAANPIIEASGVRSAVKIAYIDLRDQLSSFAIRSRKYLMRLYFLLVES